MLPVCPYLQSNETARRERRTGLPSFQAILGTLLIVIVIPCLLAYGLVVTNEAKTTAIVIGLLVALVILVRPFYGMILFAVLLYTRPEEMMPALQGLRCTLAVSLITLAGMLLHHWLNREKAVQSPLIGMIVAFGIAAVFSAFNTGNTSAAAMDIGKLVILVILMLNLVRTPKAYRILVTALLICTAYLALFSLHQYFAGNALVVKDLSETDDLERSQGIGIFGDPNDLSATIVAGLALTLSRAATTKKKARLFYLALAVIMIWAILLTNSRGGMLALLAVLGGYFLMFQRRKVLAVATAGLVMMSFLALAPSRMVSFDSSEESANSRFWFWDNGIDQLIAHPLTGVGYDGFKDVNGGMTAHNSFVLCFAELGLPGYFAWMGCLYYAFRRRRQPPEAEVRAASGTHDLLGARLALTGFLTACFWISRTYTPVMYLLICLPAVATLSDSANTGTLAPPQSWRARDLAYIVVCCIGSILFIKVFESALR